MAAAFAAVLAAGVLVLLLVTTAFPGHEGSAPATPRPLGPCEPFCSLRTTTAVPGGDAR
ncbi:hypothetical protein [Nocardia amamiensis]|uniref:hypothetical protein n=1 Tax=Nocardia amamiensis TaxID=404578 RepID=UPI0012F4E27D|nr:hypothetical protein [Nocardia amamiensis]